MKILFRVAGGQSRNKELGLGHIFRCINLAYFLKPHDLYFLLEDYGRAKNVLINKHLKNIHNIKPGILLQNDIAETINFIKKYKIDIVIIDKYKTKQKYVKEIRKFAKTVVVSDLWTINYSADLIVNGFIGYENKIMNNKFGSTCLLGPSYQILNKKYGPKKIFHDKTYDLLATFGGFDKSNITEILLRVLSRYLNRIKVKIILGPVTHKSEKIKSFEKKYGKNLKIIQQTNDMKKEISNVKFGICGGGITTYEFASMKVPFSIICQYPHQMITAKEWERKGIATNLGRVNRNLEKNLMVLLDKLLDKKIKYDFNKKLIIDGLGAKRVAHNILKL